MNYSILSFFMSWIFPTKNDRSIFRNLCHSIEHRKQTISIQKRYISVIQKLKNKKTYNVVFLINEISKWKYQSLYDAMAKSDRYNPIIVLTIADIQKKLPVNDKQEILIQNENYFKNKKMKAIIKYDLKRDKSISLEDLAPDIVFYQQPYNLPKNQSPLMVSKYAITCYVPYYLPDYKNFELDCGYDFHNLLFRFYVLDEFLIQEYKQYLIQNNKFNDNFRAVGHTMLDLFNVNKSENKNYVIYAPHWSIKHPNNENNINISTFDKNGLKILKFAQEHPEINWVFKPHPTLKTTLKRIGWSRIDIDNYYNEWEKIALTSYNSDYVDLFESSKAMITDSGSFLLEYFITGKPLIHLISDSANYQPYNHLKQYFNTFYKVTDNEELDTCLEEIILKGNDYKSGVRENLIENLKFIKENAAECILKDLDNVLEGGI